MKHRIRKLTSLLLSLSLISALTLPAAASNALGEDLSAKDTLLHQETQLSTNVFWSTTYSDLRTENLITYTPNKAVTPIVTYGDALTDRSSVADTAALLEDDGYRRDCSAAVTPDITPSASGRTALPFWANPASRSPQIWVMPWMTASETPQSWSGRWRR